MKKYISHLLILLSLLLLTGCGGKTREDLAIYRANMETFFKNVAYLDKEINKLGGSSDEEVQELLTDLDTLNDQFEQMAELDVPEDFPNVEDLADEASQNMNMAVTYFHQAYESETFQENYADAAMEYYRRANLRITYILQILHGEEVQGDNIVYTDPEEESENDG